MDKTFTIMFVPEKKGKCFSLKISFFTLTTTAMFFVAMISAAAFSFIGYMSIHHQNVSSRDLINELENKLKKTEMDKSESALYRQWADRAIQRRLNHVEKAGKGNTGSALNILDGEIKDASMPSNLFLNINDLDISRTNLHLDFNVSFKLFNRTGNHRELTGYLFIVASNNEVFPGIYGSWPGTDVLSGMPKDYKKGSPFSIRYMKQVKARINQPDIGQKFNRVDVLAYSEDGDLLMKKGFYIERLLQENPFE